MLNKMRSKISCANSPPSNIQIGLLPFKSDSDATLVDALTDPAKRELFEAGSLALQHGDTANAIRCFEHLAKTAQDVAAFNLFAAQANIEMMKEIGWDIGYMARAKKYVGQAKRLDPLNARIASLERVLKLIDTQRH